MNNNKEITRSDDYWFLVLAEGYTMDEAIETVDQWQKEGKYE